MNQPSGAVVPVGQMLVRFETAGPLDFQHFTYMIVFNTTGNGQQPYAQGYSNTDFKNWSAYFVVGGGQNFASAPALLQVFQDPASGGPRTFQLSVPVGETSFQTSIPNANAQFGFQIQFNRCLIDVAPPTNSQQNVNSSTNCPPYQHIATNWNISLFTLDATGTPVDSLGVNGPNDTSYTFPIETAVVVNTNKFKPAGGGTTSNPSAQITGIEVFSTPRIDSAPAPSPTPKP